MKKTILLLLITASFVSCEQKQENEPSNETQITSGNIEIADGWVRPGSAGMMTAAYFTIRNGTASTDTLINVTSNVTDDTQIHESFEQEGGMMGMREIGMIPIESNSSAELKPGGMHIMIIRPFQDVAEGDSVTFFLNFSNAGERELTLPVQQAAPAQ